MRQSPGRLGSDNVTSRKDSNWHWPSVTAAWLARRVISGCTSILFHLLTPTAVSGYTETHKVSKSFMFDRNRLCFPDFQRLSNPSSGVHSDWQPWTRKFFPSISGFIQNSMYLSKLLSVPNKKMLQFKPLRQEHQITEYIYYGIGEPQTLGLLTSPGFKFCRFGFRARYNIQTLLVAT